MQPTSIPDFRSILLRVLLLAVALSASVPLAANDVREQRGFAPNNVYQVGEIDSVNVSNGDVILRIPIGQEYAAGPNLRYRFTLTYNSKVWDYTYSNNQADDKRIATPEKRSNAGFGWIFSMGRMAIVRREPEPHEDMTLTYVAADGAEFTFFVAPGQGTDPKIFYAYSGQYLRLRRSALDAFNHRTYWVDFPDGETHQFDHAGNLREMRDRFGNWVKIAVTPRKVTIENPNGGMEDVRIGERWTVTDGHDDVQQPVRTHYVDFQDTASYPAPHPENFGMRIVRADLETFGGVRAPYVFEYVDDALIGHGGGGTWSPQPCWKGPLLDRVLLPDGASYHATYNTVTPSNCEALNINDSQGAILSLELPSGGSIHWTYGSYTMNMPVCFTVLIGYEEGFSGIVSRVYRDHKGQQVSEWKYTPELVRLDEDDMYTGKNLCGEVNSVSIPVPAELFTNIVESPGGLVTKHYFTAWPEQAPFQIEERKEHLSQHFGLPVSPVRKHGGRFLSTEVFDCSGNCRVNGVLQLPAQPIRRTYLSYQTQTFLHNGQPVGLSTKHWVPQVVVGQRTEFEIDASGNGAYWTDTEYSGFDGYGHFANTVTKNNFTGTEQSRTSAIERQRTIAADSWLLNLYGTSTVHEGATLTTKTKTTFDMATGFRKSVRTLADPAAEQAKDLFTFSCRDTSTAGRRGFVTSERHGGGDQATSAVGDLCTASAPDRSQGQYFLEHDYEFDGAALTKHTTQWAGTAFFTADTDFDTHAGVAKTVRDTAGIATTYKYDFLGRLEEVRPHGQAWTRYRYDRVVGPDEPIRVDVDVWPNGAQAPAGSSANALRDEHFYYDGLGRQILSKTRAPGTPDRWVATRTDYDSAGRVSAAWVPTDTFSAAFENVSPKASTRTTYDVFGRPTLVTSPDFKPEGGGAFSGGKVEYVYEGMGDRSKTRTQYVWNGMATIAAPTKEEYDGFGRLLKVTERSGTGGTDVSTVYGYDGEQLTSVTINGTQSRAFDYDGRGFLLSETHPESGTTSYAYDARGNIVRKTAAAPQFNLFFSYDHAGRPQTVKDSQSRDLKVFEYGTENDADDFRLGKLWKATRFNYPPAAALDTRLDTIQVTETYTYRLAGGRQLDRKTEVISGSNVLSAFTQSEHYNELDLPDLVTYPKCEGCGMPARQSVRTHYQFGQLDRVDEAVDSLKYAANGMWTQRRHLNGIMDVQTPDPDDMARPQEIKVQLPAPCPVIESQPAGVSVVSGSSATLTVVAPLGQTFRWYKGARGDTRVPVEGSGYSGATTNALTVHSVSATTSFWCRVTKADGCHEDSQTATIDTCVLIAQQPASTAVTQGGPVTLSLTAAHADSTFQWYQGLRGDTSAAIDGATGNVLQIAQVAATASYWCRVTRGDCTHDSDAATVQVCAPFTIDVPSADVAATTTVIQNTDVPLSVRATGSLLSYVWFSRVDGTTQLTEIGRGTDITYTPTTIPPNGALLDIIVQVTNGCTPLERRVKRLAVIPPEQLPPCLVDFKIEPVEHSTTLRDNEQARIDATIRVKQGTGWNLGLYDDIKYRFQWYENGVLERERLLDGTRPAGAPQYEETAFDEFNVGLIPTQTYARLDATVICSNSTHTVTSPVESRKTLLFKYGECPVPNVVSVPAHDVIRNGVPVTLTADSVDPRATFQWYEGESGNTLIKAFQGANQSIPVNKAGTYWVRASNDCTHADSPTVTITKDTSGTLCGPVRILTDPQEQFVKAFEPLTLSVTAGGAPAPNYWVWGDSPTHNVASGAATVTIPGPRLTTDYTVRVGNGCSAIVESRPARVHITSCADMTIVEQPKDHSLFEGDGVTLSILATSVPPLRYQWYSGLSGDTTTPIANATGPSLALSALTASGRYWVRLSFDDKTKCEVDSRTAIVSVCAAPRVTGPPHDRVSVVPGVDQAFEVSAEGEGLSYAWYQGSNTNDESQLLSTRVTHVVYPNATTDYWVKVTSDCTPPHLDQSVRIPFRVSVCPLFKDGGVPVAGTTLVNAGETTTLTVDVDRGDRIEWYKVVGTAAPVKFAEGPERESVTTAAIAEDTTFYAKAISGSCTRESMRVTIKVCTSPTVHWSGGLATQVAKGESFWLTAGLAPGETASWKWYRGAPGSDPAGYTLFYSSSHTVNVAGLDASTSYWVRATNSTTGCYDDTSVRTVNVCVPTILTQPQSVTINSNTSTTLTVTTDNLPGVSYQWFIGQPGDTSNLLQGQTANSLTVTPAATTTYWVRVSGCPTPLNPVTRNSQAATVTICAPVKIDTPPTPNVWQTNPPTELKVVASGTELAYQWYEGALNDTSKPLGTTASIQRSPSQTTDYWVRVSGRCGTALTATARISVKPGITTQPAGGPITKGTTRPLTVAASGTHLSYKWYQRPVSGSPIEIGGATGTSYTPPAVTADATYFARVFSSIAYTDSNDATFTVCLPREIDVIGYPSGHSGQQVTLNVKDPAAGESYEWYRGAAGVTSDPLGSGTTKYVTPAATTSYWIRTKRTGCDADSAVVTITICYPAITAQPEASSMINPNATKTLTVTATGTAPLAYQWYQGAHGVTTTPVGTNSNVFTTPALTATTAYWVRVRTNSTACTSKYVDSQLATVNVCQVPAIDVHPAGGWQTSGSTTLSVTASGTNLTYQWYKGLSGDTSLPQSSTSASISVSPSVTTNYWVRVSGQCGTPLNSNAAKVSVKPSIGTQPVGGVITKGTTRALTVTASGTELTYKWYQRPASGSPIEIGGATGASYTPPAIMADATYFVRVTSGIAYTDSSDATFTVCLPREIDVIGYPSGHSGQQVTLNVKDPAAGESYEWYRGAAGVTSDPLGSGTTKYVTPAVTTTYWIRTKRTGCDADSAPVTITICYPAITTQPEASSLIAVNTTKTLTVAATGTAPLVYQWYQGAPGVTTTPVGTNSSTFTTPPLTASTTYWVRVSTNSTACAGKHVQSQAATVNVCQPPNITVQPQSNNNVARGADYTLSVTATGDGLHYQWYLGDAGVTTTPVGTDSPQLPVNLTETRKYWVRVTGMCGTKDSVAALQSVKPVITKHPEVADVCGIGGMATFTVTATGADGYKWYRDWELVGTTRTLTIAVTNPAAGYKVVVTSGEASATSITVGVNMLPVPVVNSFTATQETSTRWLLRVTDGEADSSLLRYRFYEGALGDTTTLLIDTSTSYFRVTPATRPKTYWVSVYYTDTGCATNRAVTIP